MNRRKPSALSRHSSILGGFGGSLLVSQLTGAVAVPEPATWTMMILGFGAVGSMLRRRRAFA